MVDVWRRDVSSSQLYFRLLLNGWTEKHTFCISLIFVFFFYCFNYNINVLIILVTLYFILYSPVCLSKIVLKLFIVQILDVGAT